MAQGKPKFYLTTPIYYTNGLPHIGHTYTTVVADTVRRYRRMHGYEVVMTTGTDEHGVNVERAAKKAGIAESEFVAKMAEAWRALWEELGVPADLIAMPKMAPDFSALVYAVPVQLLAYHTAVFMGKDADQPRNLAKSVTVE